MNGLMHRWDQQPYLVYIYRPSVAYAFLTSSNYDISSNLVNGLGQQSYGVYVYRSSVAYALLMNSIIVTKTQ